MDMISYGAGVITGVVVAMAMIVGGYLIGRANPMMDPHEAKKINDGGE